MKLIIIRGCSGTGKTTTSIKLAKENRFQLISYDTFFFGLNRHRKFIKSDFIICFQSVLDTLENCMKNKRDCILEGVLAPIHKLDTFNFEEIIKLAKKYNCTINYFKLTASKEKCFNRMRNRGTMVNDSTYEKLVEKINLIKFKNEIIIKTDKLSINEIIDSIISNLRSHKNSPK